MSVSYKGDKLVGKSNYIEWLNPASLYLEVNGFMPYVDGTARPPSKSLYYDTKEETVAGEKPGSS